MRKGKRGAISVFGSFPFLSFSSFNLFTDKHGAAAWLSWVLIISFSVGLGAFMFKWMTGFTTSTTEKLSAKVEESDCTLIGVSILDVCQTVEELRLEIVNKKSLNVDQLVFSYVDIYDNPYNKVLNFSLRVNKKETLTILKQGIVKQFELIPKAFTDDKVITCNDNTVTVSKIRHCG
ncbi:hypothetical protein JXM83_01005 [Candidatus Woesearchaeota archaeon]|nr:hypothetical protein [Candidatus Woesearchaeota archaeon]